jgi:hypothetical protein
MNLSFFNEHNETKDVDTPAQLSMEMLDILLTVAGILLVAKLFDMLVSHVSKWKTRFTTRKDDDIAVRKAYRNFTADDKAKFMKLQLNNLYTPGSQCVKFCEDVVVICGQLKDQLRLAKEHKLTEKEYNRRRTTDAIDGGDFSKYVKDGSFEECRYTFAQCVQAYELLMKCIPVCLEMCETIKISDAESEEKVESSKKKLDGEVDKKTASETTAHAKKLALWLGDDIIRYFNLIDGMTSTFQSAFLKIK